MVEYRYDMMPIGNVLLRTPPNSLWFSSEHFTFIKQNTLLPNALYKLILRILDCCTIILQLLSKRATEYTTDRSIVHY